MAITDAKAPFKVIDGKSEKGACRIVRCGRSDRMDDRRRGIERSNGWIASLNGKGGPISGSPSASDLDVKPERGMGDVSVW